MADSSAINLAFDTWLRREVRRLLVVGVSDFAALVNNLPGVYPTTVIAVLRQMMVEDSNNHRITSIFHSASDRLSETGWKPSDILLPPHPLDYEWRFADLAIERLVSELRKSTPEAGRVALVATPSLAARLDYHDLGRQCVYLGRDAQEVKRRSQTSSIYKWETIDLGKAHTIDFSFDTVVMDPPWYSEYMHRFLWYSARLCRLDGILLISMPGAGTRPGITDELVRYQAYWEDLGFVEDERRLQFLPYCSPCFERNSLRAFGITNVPSTWRKGDLIRLRRARDCSVPWPGDLSEETWQEFVFGRVRIRVDAKALSIGNDPRLMPLVTENILPSVSRRDPIRSQVRVWTAGNRVYGCASPTALISCLEKFESMLDIRGGKTMLREPLAFYGTDHERELMKQIEMIVELESVELEDASQV